MVTTSEHVRRCATRRCASTETSTRSVTGRIGRGPISTGVDESPAQGDDRLQSEARRTPSDRSSGHLSPGPGVSRCCALEWPMAARSRWESDGSAVARCVQHASWSTSPAVSGSGPACARRPTNSDDGDGCRRPRTPGVADAEHAFGSSGCRSSFSITASTRRLRERVLSSTSTAMTATGSRFGRY